MCIPAVMAAPMAYMAAASAVMSVVSAVAAAQASKAQADYQSEVADVNRKIQEQQAADALDRGNLEATKVANKGGQMLGTEMAILSGQGFDMGGDDALNILGDQAANNQLDILTTRNNAQRDAYKYKIGAMNSGAQSELYRSQSSSINPMFSGMVAAVGGAASVKSAMVQEKWYTANTP